MNFVYNHMVRIFLLLILGFAQPDKDIYTADDGSFSVLAPGEFVEKYQELETEVGSIEVYTLHCQLDIKDHPNFLYLINYYDYPDGFDDDAENGEDEFLKNIFDESIDQSLTGLNGKLLYSTDIKLQEYYSGRVNRISYNDGESIVKSKMYLVNNRFYFLQVYTTKDNSLNLEMDDFLNSFKVLQ